jgi:uncharacterized protein (TIGR03067 family)
MKPFTSWLARSAGICLLLAFGTRLAASDSSGKSMPPQAPRHGATDETALQGEWRGIQAEWNGEKLPPTDVSQFELIIKGSAINLADAREEYKVLLHDYTILPRAEFHVDRKSAPPAIAITLDRPSGKDSCLPEFTQWKGQHLIHWSGPGRGKAAGIYELRNGTLTICWPGPGAKASPKAFGTLPGDHQLLIVFRRVEPSAHGQTFREQFIAILREWRSALGHFEADYYSARTVGDKQGLLIERAAKASTLGWQCVHLVRANSGAPEALTALCWTVGHAPRSEAGKTAIDILQQGIVARADPGELGDALDLCRGHDGRELAPPVLDVAKRHLDHPQAARLLTWVCATSMGDQSAQEPATFKEAAALIVNRFSESPDIVNFCECLGTEVASLPPWAPKYEPQLRTILAKNRSRYVRGAASWALATIVEAGGRARRDEAIRLYETILKDFDSSQEETIRTMAQFRLDQMRLRGVGMTAPELRGHDLDGKPLKLSDYRGKVVLLSFWSTGCIPCLKFVPVESALAGRLRDKPFALLGVTFDPDDAPVKEVATKHQMTWRVLRPGAGEHWSLEGVPTFYLIDEAGIIHRYWCGCPKAEELNQAADEVVKSALTKQGRLPISK